MASGTARPRPLRRVCHPSTLEVELSGRSRRRLPALGEPGASATGASAGSDLARTTPTRTRSTGGVHRRRATTTTARSMVIPRLSPERAPEHRGRDRRPSAWFHWTDLNTAIPADDGPSRPACEQRSLELRRSVRGLVRLLARRRVGGGRWGDPLKARYELLLSVEHSRPATSPRPTARAGLRFGVDSLTGRFSGSASIELGHRWYRNEMDTTTNSSSPIPTTPTSRCG